MIAFDFRGHGKSNDVFTWTALEQKDLQAIIAYAKENKYAKIGVIGFSLGAAIALIEAGCQKNIDSRDRCQFPGRFRKYQLPFLGKRYVEGSHA